MNDRIIIGDKIDFENNIESTFSFSFLPLDIFDNWTRASSLSDFIGEYYGTYFDNDASHNLISTIFNEFIENAVKFTKAELELQQASARPTFHSLLCRITNSIPKHRKTVFISICNNLFSRDLDQLFMEKIEEGAEDIRKSGIGLILIKKDYNVKTNFNFFEEKETLNSVEVTFQINLN